MMTAIAHKHLALVTVDHKTHVTYVKLYSADENQPIVHEVCRAVQAITAQGQCD